MPRKRVEVLVFQREDQTQRVCGRDADQINRIRPNENELRDKRIL